MKLRTRVTLTVTGVTAAALTASAVAALLLVRHNELATLDRALLLEARKEAKLAVRADPSHPAVTNSTIDIPERFEPAPEYAVIYDPRGVVISSTRNFGGHPPPIDRLRVTTPVPAEGTVVSLAAGSTRLRGVALPLETGGNVLLLAASREEVEADVAFLARVYGELMLVTTALAAALASVLGGRLVRDVTSLAGVAREVAGGNLAARAGPEVRGSTETRALAADLDRMIAKLGSLMAAQMTFIFHAAHELRSPLTTLRGELQLALRKPRSDAEYRETIERSLGDAEALVVLAEDLLTLARIGSDEPSTQTSTVREVVEDALRAARGPAAAEGVVLCETDDPYAAGCVPVRGARGELARALRNLLDNAIRHSPDGGRVVIEYRDAPARVELGVVDQGSGVVPEDRSQIFEPFFRGSKDQAGKDVGTGLGLAIARGLARKAGGDVVLDQNHGPGARFVLVLERAPDFTAAEPPPRPVDE
jgi:two-component system OmpR family sensor kinase